MPLFVIFFKFCNFIICLFILFLFFFVYFYLCFFLLLNIFMQFELNELNSSEYPFQNKNDKKQTQRNILQTPAGKVFFFVETPSVLGLFRLVCHAFQVIHSLSQHLLLLMFFFVLFCVLFFFYYFITLILFYKIYMYVHTTFRRINVWMLYLFT